MGHRASRLLASCGLAAAVAVGAAGGARAQAGRVRITEILASGSSPLLDEDGEAPDWVELHNPGPEDVSLEGWHMTDDLALPARWRFPAVGLPAGAYLVVFASGKDRREAGRELHLSFKLDAEGEPLALVRPDGQTLEDSFAPAFPPQRDGYAYGRGLELAGAPLVGSSAPAKVLVPTDGSLGTSWTGGAEPFDDSAARGWIAGRLAAGYDLGSEAVEPLVHFDFDDASDPGAAADQSGNGNDGRVTSHLALTGTGGSGKPAYTLGGGGHTGRPGDRALDFGLRGDGALVAVENAALGVFDSAAASDAVTVSLWVFGSSAQPDDDVVFWGSSDPDGTGIRSLNAHIPWSDSTVYWDTSGCCDGTQRISKPEPDASRWRGRWNHYAFVKDGPRKQIWQNGSLFHEGTNVARLTPIRGLFVGCAPRSGEWSYGGKIDDFALWDRTLTASQIRSLAAGASPLGLSSFAHLLGTELGAAMAGRSASAYVRVPFDVAPGLEVESLLLRMRFDAGFVAYLNGVEVARRNAPPALSFDSRATAARAPDDVLVPQDFDLSSHRGLLRPGTNVLAVHGLNDAPGSPSFLVAPELLAVRERPGRYLTPPTPGAANPSGVAGFTGEMRFSVEHGLFAEPFAVELTCEEPGAAIHYATGGAPPGPGLAGSRLYAEPIAVSRTTILRAVAVKEGFEPSRIAARSYIFPTDVARQPARPAGLPASWNGYPADYQVDPDVVGGTLPGYGLEDALHTNPSVSIAMDPADLFSSQGGIYYHSGQRWERAGSVELIHADGREGFAVGAGVRIHGYTSRDPNFTPKHSFRVTFKGDFGPSKLRHALFQESDVDRFDQVVLRGMSTDSWPVMDGWPSPIPGVPRWWRERSTYLREAWMKDAKLAMGQLSCHASFVHLYLNGLYWGIYLLTERPTESFLAEHLGGDKDEYDVLKDFAEVHGGEKTTWSEMISMASAGLASVAAYQRIQGNNPDGTRNPAFPRYLDVDDLIDYMILHIFAGADDWPNHNWWAGRRRGEQSLGFKSFPWDQEITNISLVQTQSSWGVRFEEASAYDTPAYVYSQLRANPDFRRRFGDRVHRHLFGLGALTPESCDVRWSARAEEIDRAIVAESARWGDARRAAPYVREVEWLAELDWMRDRYWPENHPIALERFRRVGLYPTLAAPEPSHPGGRIAAGLEVTVWAPAGTVHCTLDGSDPRGPTGSPAPAAFVPAGPVPIDATLTLKARARSGSQWSALAEAYYFADVPLRITEVMYHPRDPLGPAEEGLYGADDFEFLELENVGDAPVSLRGLRLEGAVRFDFSLGSIAGLGPGEIVVLPRSMSAFTTRYGARGLRVPGAYAGELKNSGERILLQGPAGEPILDFRYDDAWHLETDGRGPSLVISDPRGDPALWGLRDGWQVSRHPLGSPGRRDSDPEGGLQRPGDMNQDGELNISDPVALLGYLFLGAATAPPCEGTVDEGANRALLDSNGDGEVNLSDAVHALAYLFVGGPAHTTGVGCTQVDGCPPACGE
ncbi:MAG: CotH kinase family protein [Planctomycetes bacterium]|nr:CotH kinase family protein [Planctomycetota bacterium]